MPRHDIPPGALALVAHRHCPISHDKLVAYQQSIADARDVPVALLYMEQGPSPAELWLVDLADGSYRTMNNQTFMEMANAA